MTGVIGGRGARAYRQGMHSQGSARTIGEIVTDDFRAAAVLERYGLDFCCGGSRTLDEACHDQGVDPAHVAAELRSLATLAPHRAVRFADWPLDALVHHILVRHHTYVRSALPVLVAHTRKIAEVHGARSPELREVAQRFAAVADEMTQHMAKEEEILFPYIRALVEAERRGTRVGGSPFGTVANPIRMMEHEHEHAGSEMHVIRELTGGYVPPDFACATYRVCLRELEEFERDLHQHVHLENNILFPAALRLEEEIGSRG